MPLTFVNFKHTVTTRDNFERIKKYRVSFAYNISYFIHNKSSSKTAEVKLMTSPDGKVWMQDGLNVEVPGGQLVTLVPNYFSKYTTLEYRSKNPYSPTTLDIWFQMTRPPAKQCFGVGNDWT